MVKEYDREKKIAKVEVRNPIKVGQRHELCLPDQNILVEIKALFNGKRQPVEELHGGSQAGWISFSPDLEQDPGPYALLREKVNEFEADKVVFA